MEKIIPFPGTRRRNNDLKPPTDQPARFQEFHRGSREDHTQEKFVPEAMSQSLVVTSRWEKPLPKPRRQSAGRMRLRSPSTLRLNNSNVKRKPQARGRAK